MTRWRRVTVAVLQALPVEAGNFCLLGMMLDPGPLPPGIVPKVLEIEWVFFHFVGFRLIDWFHYHLLGTEAAGLIAAFVLAYLQTAMVLFLILEVVRRFRGRTGSLEQASQAHSSS